MEKLSGIVERITYSNEETGYSIIKIRSKGYRELVTLVGNISSINIGAIIEAKGRWRINPKYGRQFEVNEWVEKLPANIYGIEKYLGSGLIKGIGPVYAKKIVNQFKENTIKVIDGEPDRLLEINGIGKKRVELIKKAWIEQKEIKNIMMFLQSNGVSTALGYKIYKAYKDESIKIIKENPYKLVDDIHGIGFKTADTLAEKLGINKESYKRCRAGIFYVLSKLAEEGHCYLKFEELVKKSVEILGIEEQKIIMTMEHLAKEKELIKEDEIFYLPPFYYSEVGVARRLKKIKETPINRKIIDSDKIINSMGIEYAENQRKAIKLASESKVMVLTGGPGTGKTTTVNGIIRLYKESGMKVLLAAPTGRAAKRITETTGLEAKTIHRLLEYKPPEGYKKNEENKLEGDVLIIDEASMIDILLMYNLLKAIPDEMILIIVGDIDQLPSVGAGNVLKDIIESEAIPVVKLDQIFRQALGSKIVTNAHRINKGMYPDLKGGKKSNFFFIEEKENIVDLIVNLCSKRLPIYYKSDPVKDIQVLTPMQKSETGAHNLNINLQSSLNPNRIFLKRGAMEFRLKDKVMQIRNNYDKEVYNGDIGLITYVDTEEKKLRVKFDEKEVEYDILELDELTLAYAVTIHKSQGSEYPVVIIPITFSHYIMLQRNLLYTGITRAKRLVVLVGEKKAIGVAVYNNEVKKRNTRLAERLRST